MGQRLRRDRIGDCGDRGPPDRPSRGRRPGPRLTLIRPARKDQTPGTSPDGCASAQASTWTSKSQPGPDRHRGRAPAGLRARVGRQFLALHAVICHIQATGAPVRRSMIARDH
jgi:hypothetical protein